MEKISPSVEAINMVKVKEAGAYAMEDLLTVEEPMEIRLIFQEEEEIHEKSLAITMRTPGHDFELALGFLFSEGIIRHFDEVRSITYCQQSVGIAEGNVVKVSLSASAPMSLLQDKFTERHFYMTSSCGICGKASIEAVHTCMRTPLPPNEFPKVPFDKLFSMTEDLRKNQLIFQHTGGIHAVGLFDLAGQLILVREDVGRHNAMDKLIGAAMIKHLLPLKNYCIIVSGRASFELVQKALIAGAGMLGAVGAPSNLAVSLAESGNMALIGFIKEKSCNLYTSSGS